MQPGPIGEKVASSTTGISNLRALFAK